jgi:hydroxyacylglutathione hydrolase
MPRVTEFALQLATGPARLERVVVGQLAENCYLLHQPLGGTDPQSAQTLVFDPGDDAGQIIARLPAQPLAILLTHAHFDHVGAVEALRRAWQPRPLVYLHPEANSQLAQASLAAGRWGLRCDQPGPADVGLGLGPLHLAGLSGQVLYTPGHAPGHVAFYFAGQPGIVIAGDTLFRGSIGRTDLPGGDHALLIERIHSQLLSLPPDTVVFPGHGLETTVGAEARDNRFL